MRYLIDPKSQMKENKYKRDWYQRNKAKLRARKTYWASDDIPGILRSERCF